MSNDLSAFGIVPDADEEDLPVILPLRPARPRPPSSRPTPSPRPPPPTTASTPPNEDPFFDMPRPPVISAEDSSFFENEYEEEDLIDLDYDGSGDAFGSTAPRGLAPPPGLAPLLPPPSPRPAHAQFAAPSAAQTAAAVAEFEELEALAATPEEDAERTVSNPFEHLNRGLGLQRPTVGPRPSNALYAGMLPEMRAFHLFNPSGPNVSYRMNDGTYRIRAVSISTVLPLRNEFGERIESPTPSNPAFFGLGRGGAPVSSTLGSDTDSEKGNAGSQDGDNDQDNADPTNEPEQDAAAAVSSEEEDEEEPEEENDNTLTEEEIQRHQSVMDALERMEEHRLRVLRGETGVFTFDDPGEFSPLY